MKKLIVEVWKQSGIKPVNDTSKLPAGLTAIPEGMMLVEGVLGRVDSENRNKRKYPREEYRRNVELLAERIRETNGILGEMEHPKSMHVNLNNVSHKLVEIRIDEDGFVRGQILLLDTEKGKIAQSIVRSGSPLPISSRGVGKLSSDGSIVERVDIATFDLVGVAGFAEANLHAIAESVDEETGKVISEMYEYTMDGNGNVVTQDALDAIVESVEAKLVAKYDAILGEHAVTNESVTNLVNEQLTKRIDQVSNFINEGADAYCPKTGKKLVEGDDNDGDQDDEKPMTEAAVRALQTDHFINVQTPLIEKWLLTNVLPKLAEIQENWIRTEYTKELSEGLESWMFETVLPKNAKLTESWIKGEYSKDLSEGLESWMYKTVLPANAKLTESWLLNDFTKTLSEGIESHQAIVFKDLLKDLLEGAKSKKDKDVKEGEDNTKAAEQGKTGDELVEGAQAQPKKFSIPTSILENLDASISEAKRKKKLKEEEAEEEAAKQAEKDKAIAESLANEPIYVRNIPQKYVHVWKCLSEDVKSSIHRKASIFEMNTKQDVERFWNSLQLTNETLQIRPGQQAYVRSTINESVGADQATSFRSMIAQNAKQMAK